MLRYSAPVALPSVLLGVDSFRPVASGIGRVARLMARVLVEEQVGGQIEAHAVVLRDETSEAPGLAATALHGSRARFVWEMHRAALGCTHFAYDFTGVARAHCRLPGLRRPYLTWLHGIEIWEDARRNRLRCARGADLLLANSATTLERASRLHRGLDHARVCWLGTESDDAPALRRNDGPPVVLVVGRIDEGGGYKGHRELVDAWPAVVDAVPDARLVFVGGGAGEEVVRDHVRRSRAGAQIELCGFVPEARLEEAWARATVMAMPSRGEGFGLAYVEAMRRGIPVLASVHDAGAEINVDGETGYNVDLDRAGSLVEPLVALLFDRDRAASLGRAGQRRWGEHFRYSAFRARFVGLLRRWLGGAAA